MATIPEEFLDLFETGQPAQLSVIGPNGFPHVSPVFAEYVDDQVVFNTLRGRVKERCMQSNPKVGLTLLDQEEPFRYLSISGTVTEITEEGAVDHVHHIAQKFMGLEEYPYLEGEPASRVIVRVRPKEIRPVVETERED